MVQRRVYLKHSALSVDEQAVPPFGSTLSPKPQAIDKKEDEGMFCRKREGGEQEGKEEWDIPGDGTATGKHAKMATSVLRE